MSNTSVSRPTPQSLRRVVPLIVIVMGLMAIGAILIQQVAAQESRTLKPPFRLILSDKSSRAPTGILPPLDAPIIMSQTFDSSYQPVSDLGQVGWHQLVGSGATNGYTWARTNGQLITNTVWCALLNPQGSPLLDPATDTYTNGMEALLVYGPIDLSDYHTVILSTTSWLDTPAEGDYYGVAVSTDGSNFKAASWESNADASLNAPRTIIYNLSDSAAKRPAVWIGVYLASNHDGVNRRGAFLQQVVLRAVPLVKTYMPLMLKNYPPTPTPTPTATPLPYLKQWTYGLGASNEADFMEWGGGKNTSCGTKCAYIQSIISSGNPNGAMNLYLTGVTAIGAASPGYVVPVNYELSADFYLYNGQKNARYGFLFNASASTFDPTRNPPFYSDRNYYKLEMHISSGVGNQVLTAQLHQCSNGSCGAISSENSLPVTLLAGQWHTIKIVQQGASIIAYLGNQIIAQGVYDTNWGNDRRKFGIYLETRGFNNEGGRPFEIFFDNVRITQK